MKDFFLGLDIGTSSARAVAFDPDGTEACIRSREFSIISDMDGYAELDPDTVFQAAVSVIQECVSALKAEGGRPAGIGISCHMHSLIAVDDHGTPVTRVILWADTRAREEAVQIEQEFSVSELYQKTGCRVQHAMYPLSKILWLRKHQPDIYKSAFKFITIKEYIIYKLYGEYVVDYTLAASQGFYNIHRQQWDDRIIHDILGIDDSRLSQVVECTHTLKGMKTEYAQTIGIDPGTPVVIGSGDGIMANLGCGVCDDTSLSSTIGTSGAIRTAVDSPLLDPEQRTWCYSFTKDMWVAGGAINNGGIVLKWLREEFRKQFEYDAGENGESIYKLFDRFAAEIRPGSDGLIFLPYLMGERSPDWNAGVRGLMYGLGFNHGRKHIIKAAMEGVMYRMYSVYEVMSALRDNARQIRANGGYTKSDVWLQIQADIFGREILVSEVGEASALGAAYLAMVALGAVGDLKELLPGMKPSRIITPDSANHEVYRESYNKAMNVYKSVYGQVNHV